MTQIIETLELMLTREGISFPTNEGWNTIAEHIDVHNRLLSRELGFTVSWNDAMFSWYENVFAPLMQEIKGRINPKAYKDITSGELYLALSDHWFYLKEKNPDLTADAAVMSFKKQNKPTKLGFFDFIVELSEDLYASRRISFGDLFIPTEDGDHSGPKRNRAA